MILVVDSSALALLINPDADPPDDPATGRPVANARERVRDLLASLSVTDTLIVPTPVLAEVLVKAGDAAPLVLDQLQGQARIRVRPFDARAAVEVAMMTRTAIEAGDKRGGSDQPWQKVKYDRQIIAVARVAGATRIYADDHGLVSFAKLIGSEVTSTWDLPVPEVTANLFTVAGLTATGHSNPSSEE